MAFGEDISNTSEWLRRSHSERKIFKCSMHWWTLSAGPASSHRVSDARDIKYRARVKFEKGRYRSMIHVQVAVPSPNLHFLGEMLLEVNRIDNLTSWR